MAIAGAEQSTLNIVHVQNSPDWLNFYRFTMTVATAARYVNVE